MMKTGFSPKRARRDRLNTCFPTNTTAQNQNGGHGGHGFQIKSFVLVVVIVFARLAQEYRSGVSLVLCSAISVAKTNMTMKRFLWSICLDCIAI